MKKRYIGVLLILMVLGMAFTGCNTEPEISTYTIYVKSFIFSSSDPVFGDLQDGYYTSFEISQADFNWEISNNFYDISPNYWTVDQIVSSLQGMGFSNNIANQEASNLVSFKHFMIVSRDGSSLRMMMK